MSCNGLPSTVVHRRPPAGVSIVTQLVTQLHYSLTVDPHSKRADTGRVLGTLLLVAGFLTLLLTILSGYAGMKPHLVAFLLVLTGIGLRIEAAITDRRL